jgi:hypothetical protein
MFTYKSLYVWYSYWVNCIDYNGKVDFVKPIKAGMSKKFSSFPFEWFAPNVDCGLLTGI